MIHGVFGKLGSGKGLLVVDIVAKELLDGFRDVVTNVPLRFMPWVNGQGIPQIGLRSYLIEKLGNDCSEDSADEILKRVLVIEDIDKGGDLFMWRRDGDTGEWFKLEVTKLDDKGRPERFDAAQIKTRHCAPVLCVTDEAWQFYPNSGGWARVPLLPFYARQQRKLRDEWFIVTQHPSDVDMVLWNIAQDFWVCRNHGMERMGFFRQPSMFRVIVYLSNPAKGNAIRSHEFYRRLDKKISQCYDTTAGVGITGGFKGDSNQKKSGLHLGWLILAIVLVVVALMSIPLGLRRMVTPFLTQTLSGRVATNAAAAKASGRLPSASESVPVSVQSAASALDDGVFCTGYAVLNNSPMVFLSDGRVARADSGQVQSVGSDFVVVFGRQFPVRAQKPVYVEQPVTQWDSPTAGMDKPVNRADILQSIHGVSPVRPPRLGGLESMQRQFAQPGQTTFQNGSY
jgi:hypothetical protein